MGAAGEYFMAPTGQIDRTYCAFYATNLRLETERGLKKSSTSAALGWRGAELQQRCQSRVCKGIAAHPCHTPWGLEPSTVPGEAKGLRLREPAAGLCGGCGGRGQACSAALRRRQSALPGAERCRRGPCPPAQGSAFPSSIMQPLPRSARRHCPR